MGLPKRREESPHAETAGATMGFLEHLDELRTRLIRSCAALLAMYLIGIVIAWLVQPRNREAAARGESALRLVFAATVIDQARRRPAGDAPTTVRPHRVTGGRRG